MTPAPTLRAEGLSLGYGTDEVVHSLDLDIPAGRVTALIGANGSGKSTLLRGLTRLLAPLQGRVVLDGTDIHRMNAKDLARRMGLLPQSPVAPGGLTVGELVALGRAPYQGWLGRASEADRRAVASALELTRTTDLADRSVDELSGGQRQRAWIAMVLAQETEVLLLDEPTTFLDLAHAVDVLDTISELNETRATTVVMVLHDLTLAARYADHLVVLRDGRVLAQGQPGAVLTPALLKAAFDLTAHVVADPVTGTPMVVPLGRTRTRSGDSLATL